jgi:outer membrane protein TolC
MKKQTFFIVFWLLFAGLSEAQEPEPIPTNTLSLENFISIVKEYHPVSQQAALLLLEGENTVKRARGAFDPYLYGNINQKYFDEKSYYSLIGAGLKIPTWYGVEVEAGYDQNRGEFLNPEKNLPQDGLWNAGISISLGKGLFIDERRAMLRMAEVFADFTRAEQEIVLNDLYFDAIKQYWDWLQSWNKYQIFEEALELAEERFIGIRQSFVFGDLPAIDTLEALIQVQQREMQRNQAMLEYQNTTLMLSNFLWFENNTPLEITDDLRPPEIDAFTATTPVQADSLIVILSGLGEVHPEMKLVNTKLAGFDIERRMKAESLKPMLNLKYNMLMGTQSSSETQVWNTQDYVWGLEFGIPLFLRKERADLKLTKLKIQDTRLDNNNKLLALQNKVKNYYNNQQVLETQVELYSETVINNNRLLEGEKKKFRTGESSVFMVNTREMKYIEARLKLNELQTKFFIANTGFVWAMGTLYLL